VSALLLTALACLAGPLPVAAPPSAELLGALCPTGQVQGDACGQCPSGGTAGKWTIGAALPGHFTAPDADEVALWLPSPDCATTADEGGFFVLAVRAAGVWKGEATSGALRVDHCVALRGTDGRDRLACGRERIDQSVTSSWIELDDAEDDPPSGEGVASAATGLGGCEPPFGEAHIDPAISLVVAKGRTEVVANATLAEGKVPSSYTCGDAVPFGPVQRLRLVFVWDGEQLKPTPETATLMARFPKP